MEMFFKRRSADFIQEKFKQFQDVAGLLRLEKMPEIFSAIGLHLHEDDLKILFMEMDLNNDEGLDLEEFTNAVSKTTRLEQWAATLPLPQLLAACLPLQQHSLEPLRDLSQLNSDDMNAAATAMSNGVRMVLTEFMDQLKASLDAIDKLKIGSEVEGCDKFQSIDMECGTLVDFHEGLIGRVGAPHPIPSTGMENEHCVKKGCEEEFTTSNYNIKTCARKEYLIATGKVICPDCDKQDREGKEVRVVKPISEIMDLDLVKTANLVDEEALTVVLYTGPLFQLYNMVLRRYPKDTFRKFKQWNNLFPTTIHVLVSAIIKIARVMKLPMGLRLYRGLGAKLRLPPRFWKADEHGCRGYMEWGFLSTTADKAVAVKYSGAGMALGGAIPSVLCLRVGSVDRGARIVELSQYPHEVEYLYVPCSFIEPTGEQAVELVVNDGSKTPTGVVTVVGVRVNANLKARTIEELREQKRTMHLTAFRYMCEELRRDIAFRCEEPQAKARIWTDLTMAAAGWSFDRLLSRVETECQKRLEAHEALTWKDYEDDAVYRSLVIDMLDLKTQAMSLLRSYLEDSSQYLSVLLDLSLRDVHRGLMAYLKRRVAGEQGEARARSASELCKIRGLMEGEIDKENEAGEAPIMTAAADGRSGADVLLLVQAGSAQEHIDQALLFAAKQGHRECAETLIAAKADLSVKDTVRK